MNRSLEISPESAEAQIVKGEHLKRSVVKTISWRLIGTIATIIISYVITGTLALAFSIGVVEMISKMILYFFHERAWSHLEWGK